MYGVVWFDMELLWCDVGCLWECMCIGELFVVGEVCGDVVCDLCCVVLVECEVEYECMCLFELLEYDIECGGELGLVLFDVGDWVVCKVVYLVDCEIVNIVVEYVLD